MPLDLSPRNVGIALWTGFKDGGPLQQVAGKMGGLVTFAAVAQATPWVARIATPVLAGLAGADIGYRVARAVVGTDTTYAKILTGAATVLGGAVGVAAATGAMSILVPVATGILVATITKLHGGQVGDHPAAPVVAAALGATAGALIVHFGDLALITVWDAGQSGKLLPAMQLGALVEALWVELSKDTFREYGPCVDNKLDLSAKTSALRRNFLVYAAALVLINGLAGVELTGTLGDDPSFQEIIKNYGLPVLASCSINFFRGSSGVFASLSVGAREILHPKGIQKPQIVKGMHKAAVRWTFIMARNAIVVNLRDHGWSPRNAVLVGLAPNALAHFRDVVGQIMIDGLPRAQGAEAAPEVELGPAEDPEDDPPAAEDPEEEGLPVTFHTLNRAGQDSKIMIGGLPRAQGAGAALAIRVAPPASEEGVLPDNATFYPPPQAPEPESELPSSVSAASSTTSITSEIGDNAGSIYSAPAILAKNKGPEKTEQNYSTVTDLAKLRGLSTSVPRATAV